MNGETTYTKISDKDFIRLLEKSIKDANNYCEKLQQEKDNLIKYLEDKIKKLNEMIEMWGIDIQIDNDALVVVELNLYQDILERVKSGKYE